MQFYRLELQTSRARTRRRSSLTCPTSGMTATSSFSRQQAAWPIQQESKSTSVSSIAFAHPIEENQKISKFVRPPHDEIAEKWNQPTPDPPPRPRDLGRSCFAAYPPSSHPRINASSRGRSARSRAHRQGEQRCAAGVICSDSGWRVGGLACSPRQWEARHGPCYKTHCSPPGSSPQAKKPCRMD